MAAQLAFHETQFNIVSRHNTIYLTAVEIAQALGYKKPDAVTQIYERNSDEFTHDMSETLNLSVSGNLEKSVRIFSLRGAHLIAMFARTPVAKEFRRWVLDILDREVGEPVRASVKPTPTYPPFSGDYANRTELIYYHDFKPIFCRLLNDDEVVISHESMKEWLEMQGLVFFTRDEIKNFTVEKLMRISNGTT
ncbi:BRO-N domain-containing protein [Yokenella regensburgei]|uniref:BRO-N domain-containing protein n=1 Tax=Yokenella regensburgei TaxID=158877 RepID=UPI0035AEDA23